MKKKEIYKKYVYFLKDRAGNLTNSRVWGTSREECELELLEKFPPGYMLGDFCYDLSFEVCKKELDKNIKAIIAENNQ